MRSGSWPTRKQNQSSATACALTLCLALLGCSENSANKAAVAETPWFEDQAQQRGLDFEHQSGRSVRYLLPEIVGGGAALADLDGDGDLDAYLVQSGKLFAADAPGNQLFFNVGDGHFEEAAGGGGAGDKGYGKIGRAHV